METDRKYIRCTVQRWDERYIYATIQGTGEGYRTTYDDDLRPLLREGMQLNVLGDLIVVEPDFLVDVSALATLFSEDSHHPLLYTIGRMLPRANSQAILLGNFAGSALDDIINHEDATLGHTLTESFREQALQFCTCPDFSPLAFKADAQVQMTNLRETVGLLFDRYDREKAILEPSFICERLGLQGRVDMMTTDMQLLVEQKSGKLWGKEHGAREPHIVQLLLYYGMLHYNFDVAPDNIDMRLLYSRYPAQGGLIKIGFNEALFREAIAMRNRVVAQELQTAREGFNSVLPRLTIEDSFGRFSSVSATLASLSDAERSYFEQQMTFVYREQAYNKLGTKDKRQRVREQSRATADLWNLSLDEKREAGSILTDLTIVEKEQSAPDSGYDVLTLTTHHSSSTFNPAPSTPIFRRGDMVVLYAYQGVPDVRKSLLFRGRLTDIRTDQLTIKLNDGQQNPNVFDHSPLTFLHSPLTTDPSPLTYAVEPDTSDIGTTSAMRSLYAFVTSPLHKRQLLLGQREPQADDSIQLTRCYHPNYDDVILRQKQARDYFLLIGPPGTGKTSMALRFMVEEELALPPSILHLPPSILLMAYTNRAVDEICETLSEAGLNFLRLGNEASCDPRFRGHLLDALLGDTPKLDEIRQRISQTSIVVSTTATMQSRPFIFQLKRFSLCVVDEASQILESDIVGLLANDAIGRFVLIGDYKQLPAVVQQPGKYETLFERLIRLERQQGRTRFVGTLRHQGRMHPDIAAFANEMFYRQEQLEPVPLEHQLETRLNYDEPSEDALDDVLKERRVVFLDVEGVQAEAAVVADLLRRIYRQYGAARFDSNKTAGVIVPYRHQIALIRQEIERLGIPALQQISIDTVERYQGSQRDVIIYSFTVQQLHQLDFLTACCFEEDGQVIDRKLNVALTRARKQLLITGCTAILQHNPLFAELIRRYRL